MLSHSGAFLSGGGVHPCHTSRGEWGFPLPFIVFLPYCCFSLSLLVQLLYKGCTTQFPCSNNSCCSDSSLNPVLMLMADDRQGKQKLHFRGKFIKPVYCLLCAPCRASGISSTDADTCLETHLLSPEPLQYRREEGNGRSGDNSCHHACT